MATKPPENAKPSVSEIRESYGRPAGADDDVTYSINLTKPAVIIGAFLMLGMIGGAWVYQINQSAPAGPDAPVVVVDGQTLGQIAGDNAPTYAQFYRDLASIVEADAAGQISSTGKFNNLHVAAVIFLKGSKRLPDVPGLNPPITAKINQAIGDADKALDADSRAALVAVLRQIADELDPPPKPEEE